MLLGSWQPLALPGGPLRLASREQAIETYEFLMQHASARCDVLQQLAKQNQVDISVVATASDAHAVGTWLHSARATLVPDAPICHGLAIDVSLWLGQGLINAAPGLRWQLLVSHKKSTGYQRAVLTGFAKVDDPHYYVDIAHFVASWLDYASRGRVVKPSFLASIYQTTLADA